MLSHVLLRDWITLQPLAPHEGCHNDVSHGLDGMGISKTLAQGYAGLFGNYAPFSSQKEPIPKAMKRMAAVM